MSEINKDVLQKTGYKIPIDFVKQSNTLLDEFLDFKTPLNYPTGNFFYDPWKIKKKYKETIFAKLLNTLPFSIGEARIIKLPSGQCYLQHADIDDRYHLHLSGKHSYLIDVDNSLTYQLSIDCQWYEMDAGRIHSAANLGYEDRYQLVVRKLLNNVILNDFKNVTIKPICDKARFRFDNLISPWLNYANKRKLISSFEVIDAGVRFNITTDAIGEIKMFDKKLFDVAIE